LSWFRVTKTWYVEAETVGDALAITPPNPPGVPTDGLMTDAEAERIDGSECCNGTGLRFPDTPQIPCGNPRCPTKRRGPGCPHDWVWDRTERRRGECYWTRTYRCSLCGEFKTELEPHEE